MKTSSIILILLSVPAIPAIIIVDSAAKKRGDKGFWKRFIVDTLKEFAVLVGLGVIIAAAIVYIDPLYKTLSPLLNLCYNIFE